MKTITMLKTAAGPDYIMHAGKTYRVTDEMEKDFCNPKTAFVEEVFTRDGKEEKIKRQIGTIDPAAIPAAKGAVVSKPFIPSKDDDKWDDE